MKNWPMKNWLHAGAAMTAFIALAGTANADKIKLSLGGYLNLIVFNASQDTTGFGANSSLRELGLTTEGEIHVKGKATLDNGTEVGIRVEIEIEADNASGGQGPNSDIIDELWFYAQGGWGRFEFGQQDGVADQLMVFAPRVLFTAKVDDPEIFFIQDASQNPYRPNSLRLRTDSFETDDNTKIIYLTPRLSGFQFGISYMPEPTKNFSGFVTRKDNTANEQAEVFEVGANYDGTIGDATFKAALVYLTGSNEAPTAANRDDLEGWGTGVQIGYEGFTLGGSYRFSNARGGSSLTNVFTTGSDTNIWSGGATYKTGPWVFGAQYIDGVTELNAAGAEQNGTGYEFATSYEIGEGLTAAVGFQSYSYNSDLGFDANSGDLDADILYTALEVTM